jgi:hypothetical protein
MYVPVVIEYTRATRIASKYIGPDTVSRAKRALHGLSPVLVRKLACHLALSTSCCFLRDDSCAVRLDPHARVLECSSRFDIQKRKSYASKCGNGVERSRTSYSRLEAMPQ